MNEILSPLLKKYQESYRKNPSSRTFAPLAEIYRREKKIEEAIRILKRGIRLHPDYLLGYLTLARCYYDIDQYELAYTTVRPFVKKNLDNITLQRLFAEVCLKLNQNDEALDTYKHLLYINPKDPEAIARIKDLEAIFNVLEDESSHPLESEFEEGVLSFNDTDSWVQIDFSKQSVGESEFHSKKPRINDKTDPDDWSIEESNSHSLAQYEQQIPDEEITEEESTPLVMTHTLADLYAKQNHLDKAIAVLEQILEKNPRDLAAAKKLSELKNAYSLQDDEELVSKEVESEDLMDVFDKSTHRFRTMESKMASIESKFAMFLTLIKERATQHG